MSMASIFRFASRDIAIDLGTANTLVYVKGEGIVLNEPSVVAMEKATNKIKGIGLEAKRMLGRTPEGVTAVRPLKDGVIADVDVTEIMLRYFLETVTSKRFLKLKPTMVVGVPSGITELARRAVRSSAQESRRRAGPDSADPVTMTTSMSWSWTTWGTSDTLPSTGREPSGASRPRTGGHRPTTS